MADIFGRWKNLVCTVGASAVWVASHSSRHHSCRIQTLETMPASILVQSELLRESNWTGLSAIDFRLAETGLGGIHHQRTSNRSPDFTISASSPL